MSEHRQELIDRADLDELTRYVERVADQSDWEELVWTRNDCRAAAARGKQLWPVTAYVDYVLALLGPGKFAAEAIEDAAGPGAAAARFGFGPLAEVAASTHHWSEVGPHLQNGPSSGLFAHECVVRGESLLDQDVDGSVLDIPLELAAFEPEYEPAHYTAEKAEFPAPALPDRERWDAVTLQGVEFAEDDDATEGREALLEVVAHWSTESNGRIDASGVEGDVFGALRSLGLSAGRIVEVTPTEAFAHIAWAAGSGGAHGRRRGVATGRFGAWWTAAALLDLLDDWPLSGDELRSGVSELRWYLWDEGVDPIGWSLRIAVEDPEAHLAWALIAADAD